MKSPWLTVFDEIISFGARLTVDEQIYVRKSLEQVYLQGVIDALKGQLKIPLN